MDTLHGMDRSQTPSKDSHSSTTSINIHDDELKHFSQAKNEIDNIFNEIDNYMSDQVKSFIEKENASSTSASSLPGFDCDAWLGILAKKSNRIKLLSERVSRNHMKVVFFGRTSNGKSTTINAILQEGLLPATMGNTTSCFLQVQKSEEGEENYIQTDDDNISICSGKTGGKKVVSIENHLNELANSLKSNSLKPDSLLNIFWSPQKCPILKHDIKIVDSPGIDVTPDIDAWIQKYCLDADVFVFVANAESTINQAEKNFFQTVAKHVSKPNIFILNNRWDMAAWNMEWHSEEREAVQQQHRERCLEFLVDELGVCSRSEATERIFFVSAKEVYQYRTSKNPDQNIQRRADGWNERLNNFQKFERLFSHCLSRSAVETRFSEPAKTVSKITEELSANFNRVLELCQENSIIAQSNYKELNRREAAMDQERNLAIQEFDEEIDKIVEYTRDFISTAMNDEIRRLEDTVFAFRGYFNDKEPESIENYKKKLFNHVRKALKKNITLKCGQNLIDQIKEVDQQMGKSLQNIENISQTGLAQISAEPTSDINERKPPTFNLATFTSSFDQREFEKQLEIDAPSIGIDFKEDLNFKFSLGLSNLMSKMGNSGNQNLRFASEAMAPLKDVGNCISLKDGTNKPEVNFMAVSKILLFGDGDLDLSGNFHLSSSSFLLSSIPPSLNSGPQLTTAATIGYGAYKLMGWRIVAALAGTYTSIYLWERTMWNNRAKERALKKQFAIHAKSHILKRRNLTAEESAETMSNSLNQRKLAFVQSLEQPKSKIVSEISSTQVQIDDIERIQKDSKKLRNTSDWIHRQVDNFAGKYFGNFTDWNQIQPYRSQLSILEAENGSGDNNASRDVLDVSGLTRESSSYCER